MQHTQTDIFSADHQALHFAELCNALYERELSQLANSSLNQASLLKRRLSGLSHHIKSAARFLTSHNTPLEVDFHNASWQAKQAPKPFSAKQDGEKCRQWVRQCQIGMPLVVAVIEHGQESLELDSIDRIDSEQPRIHLNKHGWFNLTGEWQQTGQVEKRWLLPDKASYTAACCGHTWTHKGKGQPRALTLRELLLSTRINWKNPKVPLTTHSR